jgi:hypothetical protein
MWVQPAGSLWARRESTRTPTVWTSVCAWLYREMSGWGRPSWQR